MENTCKTCINNDDGLCDRKGILVEDEDSCEHHWAAGKKIRMKRRLPYIPTLHKSVPRLISNTFNQACKGILSPQKKVKNIAVHNRRMLDFPAPWCYIYVN